MTTNEVIETAARNAEKGDMVSSAKLALRDARSLAAQGKAELARRRALTSLSYSVGIFHPDYEAVYATCITIKR